MQTLTFSYESKLLAETVKSIVRDQIKYQTQIRDLKKQGFSIIGYARKSVGYEDLETRIKLLRLMCRRLKERSIVDRVFVFYSSQASDLLSQRDMKQENELLTQLFAEGSTQGKQMRVLLYTY